MSLNSDAVRNAHRDDRIAHWVAEGGLDALLDEHKMLEESYNAERSRVPAGHRAILIQQARELSSEHRAYDDTEHLVDVLVMAANLLAQDGEQAQHRERTDTEAQAARP